MNFKSDEKSFRASLVCLAVFGLLAGILLIALPADALLKFIFVIVGIVTVVYQLPGIVTGLAHLDTGAGKVSLILSLISAAIGFLMIFFHSTVLLLILGAYLIFVPIVQIVVAKERLLVIKSELPKIILGVVLLIVGPAKALGFLFDVAGWIILVLSALYVVISLIVTTKRKTKYANTTGGRVFVDTTGDGKIDTVYVDTTGDGKPDTAKRYRDGK